MKRKEVEDVMGGKDAWANVDKTDGMGSILVLCRTRETLWRIFCNGSYGGL